MRYAPIDGRRHKMQKGAGVLENLGGVVRNHRDPHELIPLRPVEFEILLVLTGGDAHGWAIIKEAESRSRGNLRIETGTLYRALSRLTRAGLVQPAQRRPAPELDDERRRYHSITPFGREVAGLEAERLACQVEVARERDLLVCLGAGGDR
jgi:DNA-binding PadR family transcriptional regulator